MLVHKFITLLEMKKSVNTKSLMYALLEMDYGVSPRLEALLDFGGNGLSKVFFLIFF